MGVFGRVNWNMWVCLDELTGTLWVCLDELTGTRRFGKLKN